MTIPRKKKRAKFPLASMIPRLERWFSTPLGRELIASEQALIDDKLRTFFGYRLLQLSIGRDINLSAQSTIRHRFSMTPLSEGNRHCAAVCELDMLPLESDSVDVVLLHHVLEYSQTPHQLLREAERITVPHGYVVVVGFNPWSLLGSWSMMARKGKKSVWQNRHLSSSRLYDWLSLLDLDVVSVDYCFYRPPFKQAKLLKRLSFLERIGRKYHLPVGGCYILVAKKEASTLTPIKPKWFTAANLVPGLEPTLYNHKLPKKNRLH